MGPKRNSAAWRWLPLTRPGGHAPACFCYTRVRESGPALSLVVLSSNEISDGAATARAAKTDARVRLCAQLRLVARLGFAFGSTHWFKSDLASFSTQCHVPSET